MSACVMIGMAICGQATGPKVGATEVRHWRLNCETLTRKEFAPKILHPGSVAGSRAGRRLFERHHEARCG